jgi:hypothetical protein
MTTDRERFEKLAAPWCVHFRRDEDGDYLSPHTYGLWEFYQSVERAALAQPVAAVGDDNQCDGCLAGYPVNERGFHIMGSGKYPDPMACQAHRYRATQPDEARELLKRLLLWLRTPISTTNNLYSTKSPDEVVDDFLAAEAARGK